MLPIGSNIERREVPRITLILMALCVVAYLIEILIFNKSMFAAFSYGPRNWYNPVAIFTSMFLHGSLSHLFFNLLFLWIFGASLEERLGWKRYLGFYLGAGVASALLYTGMRVLQHGDQIGAIGASGAVSGMMALYVYRCFYARLRLVIDPLFLPIKFNIPALPFVAFYYVLPGLYAGSSPEAVTNVAHWGHIGGFLFGIVAARMSRLGHEGQIEKLRHRINKALEEEKGIASVEKELLAIEELVPNDPEVKLDLARLYANTARPAEALRYYAESIGTYFVKDPLVGAFTVNECVRKLGKPMDFKYHLKAGEVLVRDGSHEEARQVLLTALRQKLSRNPVIERTLALFARVNAHLDKRADAQKAFAMLQKGFPKSQLIKPVGVAIGKPPGEVLPPPVPAGDRKLEQVKAEAAMDTMNGIAEVAFDPFFIFIWLGFRFLAAIVMFVSGIDRWFGHPVTEVVIFAIALLGLIEHRTHILRNLAGRKEQRRKAREFDRVRNLENARMAEKKEDFKLAAKLYEKHVDHDPGDMVSRYTLGRIYQNRLDKKKKAIEHYRYLIEATDPTAPVHGHATDALVELGEMEAPEGYGEEG